MQLRVASFALGQGASCPAPITCAHTGFSSLSISPKSPVVPSLLGNMTRAFVDTEGGGWDIAKYRCISTARPGGGSGDGSGARGHLVNQIQRVRVRGLEWKRMASLRSGSRTYEAAILRRRARMGRRVRKRGWEGGIKGLADSVHFEMPVRHQVFRRHVAIGYLSLAYRGQERHI